MDLLKKAAIREVRLSWGGGGSPPQKNFFLWLSLDFLFTQTVVNLLSTASWRGVWNLLDEAVTKDFGSVETLNGLLVSCLVGVLLNILAYIISPALDNLLTTVNPLLSIFISRLFTAAYFITSMLLWSSFWNLLTVLVVKESHLLASTTIASIILICAGCFNTVNGVPATVSTDWGGGYCVVSTRLEEKDLSSKSPSAKALWKCADWVCTVILEIFGIQAWHGAETFISSQLPAPPQVSLLFHCLLPVALGSLLGAVAFFVQMLVLYCLETWEGKDEREGGRRIAEALLSTLGLVSSVLHWYGVWTLLDSFFLPSQPITSNLVSAFLGIGGLCLLGASKSLHGGVTRDSVPGSPLPIQPYYLLPLLAARDQATKINTEKTHLQYT